MTMRPWQNAFAIVATFIAAGVLLPWDLRLRIVCALLAFTLIVVLFVSRMRQHAKHIHRESIESSQERIDRIRAARSKRFGDR